MNYLVLYYLVGASVGSSFAQSLPHSDFSGITSAGLQPPREGGRGGGGIASRPAGMLQLHRGERRSVGTLHLPVVYLGCPCARFLFC